MWGQLINPLVRIIHFSKITYTYMFSYTAKPDSLFKGKSKKRKRSPSPDLKKKKKMYVDFNFRMLTLMY